MISTWIGRPLRVRPNGLTTDCQRSLSYRLWKNSLG
jgi:hypothetical protein